MSDTVFYVTDESYARTEPGYLGNLGSRAFSKTYEGLCFAAFVRSSNGWVNCCLIGPTPESVNRTPYMELSTFVLESGTYYFGAGGAIQNQTPTGEGRVPYIDLTGQPSNTYELILTTLLNQNYFGYRPLNVFTVSFNSNGGVGSMEPLVIEIDTPTPLSPCSFTREEYSFAGWSRTADGTVEFQDGEIVENLAEAGETVELFAVWTPLPPRFLLQFNPTDNEHLDKDLQTVHDLHGYFRDGCSVEDPVVLLAIDPADLAGVNYFTIPALRRGYFLTGQTVVRTGLVEISGHVDVLSSFATEIRQQRAIVRRAQSSDAFNLYLNDGSLKSYQNPYILTELFPNGFTGQSFVLSVAGSSTPPNEP